jgi:hypothetical protein
VARTGARIARPGAPRRGAAPAPFRPLRFPPPAAPPLLQAASHIVHLPCQLEGERMVPFTAIAVERCTCDLPTALAAGPGSPPPRQPRQAAPPPRRGEFVTDGLLFAGAPVWALDWCPWPAARSAPGPLEAVELLAVATHPKGIPRSRLGAAQRGPGSFQLWAVPHGAPAAGGGGSSRGRGAAEADDAEAGAAAAAAALPRCVAIVQHGGRLAWDLKWCPDPSAMLAGGAAALASPAAPAAAGEASGGGGGGGGDGAVPLQGVLAAVLGDGSVAVYAVPSVAALEALGRGAAQQQGRRPGGAAAPRQRRAPGQQARRRRGSSGEESSDEEMAGQEEAAVEEGGGGGGSCRADAGAEAVAAAAAAAGAVVLDLAPVAALAPDANGGALASCCAWSPSAPHAALLVGCWDGHVALWQLPTGAGGRTGVGVGDCSSAVCDVCVFGRLPAAVLLPIHLSSPRVPRRRRRAAHAAHPG